MDGRRDACAEHSFEASLQLGSAFSMHAMLLGVNQGRRSFTQHAFVKLFGAAISSNFPAPWNSIMDISVQLSFILLSNSTTTFCFLSLIYMVAQFHGFFLLQPWLPAYRCPGWPGGFERDVEWEVTQAFSSLQLSWGRPNSILPQLVPLHFCWHHPSQDLPPHLGRLSLRGNQGEFLFLISHKNIKITKHLINKQMHSSGRVPQKSCDLNFQKPISKICTDMRKNDFLSKGGKKKKLHSAYFTL